MLKPKTVTIRNRDGVEKAFVISRVPAVEMREIVATYPLSAMPKIGDYKVNEAVMLKMLAYVGVPRDGGEPLMLTTKVLVDNHAGDWEALARLEIAMFEYNTSFFDQGVVSTFLEAMLPKVSTLISSMLTGLLEQLSQAAKRVSKNSDTTTT